MKAYPVKEVLTARGLVKMVQLPCWDGDETDTPVIRLNVELPDKTDTHLLVPKDNIPHKLLSKLQRHERVLMWLCMEENPGALWPALTGVCDGDFLIRAGFFIFKDFSTDHSRVYKAVLMKPKRLRVCSFRVIVASFAISSR